MVVDQLSIYQDVPDKEYFRIGEVAELAGVPSYVLRFWESEFTSIHPKTTDSGQRLYRKSDVELILTIKHLLHEKRFTIEGAKQHLHQSTLSRPSEFITEIDSHVDESDSKNSTPVDDQPQQTDTLLKEVYLELRRIRDLLVCS
jgi:DNA-binding transcriptional MerR regulator